MIIEIILFFSLFHHKKKVQLPSPEQQAWTVTVENNHKILADGVTGARAFEDDWKYAQYERPELDAFEHQLFKCSLDYDEHDLDKDIDVLIELGKKLMSIDEALHHENVI